jgi:hypothetical protein
VIRHYQRPVLLLEPVRAKSGSWMVKCGELTLKLRLDFTYDRESKEAVQDFVAAYRRLFEEHSVDEYGTVLRLGEVQVFPPPRPVQDEEPVVDAEFEEAEPIWCTKHVMCRGHDRCVPRWKRWWYWFKRLPHRDDTDRAEQPYPWSWW